MPPELIPVSRDFDMDVTIRGLNATQRVFDRYSLRRILGRGGMGIVWLSLDERLEREVALKFLPDDVFFDPVALDELKRETRRCLELTHPNIIRIYDFIKDEQAAAISMEYVDGKSLAELRIEKPERVFEVAEVRSWVAAICQALHYAHTEAGVIHRDLKPANLMLTSRGQIKIADFGIAQSMADSMSRRTVRRGTSSGTLAYMSPQQLNGEVARFTDDIYALAATIYELLTGKPPFHSGDVAFQIRLGVPKSVTERRAEFGIGGQPIPQEWEETLEACLSKIPAERPSTMEEVAERLGLTGKNSNRAIPMDSGIERPRKIPSLKGFPPPLPKKEKTKQVYLLMAAVASVIGMLILLSVLFVKVRERSASISLAAMPPSSLSSAEVPVMDPPPVVPKLGGLETAGQPLGEISQQYPDDLKILLAQAQIQTRVPPTSDSLTKEIKAMQKFAAGNKTFAAEPALLAMQRVFADEQTQLELVVQQLKVAKKGPETLQDEIDDLQSREVMLRHRRVGAPRGNPFSTTINFFGKAVTGHSVVDNAAYFSSSEAKRDAIADVQAQIEADRLGLAQPPASLQAAQTQYDLFIAHVPWGSASDPAAPMGATAALTP